MAKIGEAVLERSRPAGSATAAEFPAWPRLAERRRRAAAHGPGQGTDPVGPGEGEPGDRADGRSTPSRRR